MRSAPFSPPEFSTAKQLLLERRLQGAMGSASKQPTIGCYPRRESAPLSFAQQRLWFLDQLIGGSAVYNISEVLRLKGPLDIAALEWSLAEIVRRHESLRTTFSSPDGQPLQVISESATLKLEVTDLEHFPAPRRDEEMHRLAVADSKKPFDLTRDLMIRASLFRLSEKEHVLAITMHHIASDAWSLGILYQELTELYGGRVSGQPATLPELPIQYADYAIWQREWLQGKLLEEQLGYWKEQLAGAPDLLELPTDKARPAVQSFRGGNVSITLP